MPRAKYAFTRGNVFNRSRNIDRPPSRSLDQNFFHVLAIANRETIRPISLFFSTPRNRLVSVCSLSKFVSAKVRRFPRRIPLFHTPEFPPPSYYLDNRNSPTRVNLIMCSCRTPRQPAEFWILAIPLVRCTWDTESLEKKASLNEPRDGKEGERRKIEEGKNHESL